MNHLTTEQLFRYVDETLPDAERSQLESHLLLCLRCRREVELQITLARITRELPLVKPSNRFTERVMASVLPKPQLSWVTKIINNLGNVFAMMLVLGVLGYVLFSPSFKTDVQPSKPSQLSEALKTFSGFYNKFSNVLVHQSTQLTKGSTATSSGEGTKILLFTIVCLVVLASFDKFIIQRKVHTKL
ncbi:MAG: zf-HC2 domain-containing protein [Ignavibacteriales bacterium]|nr:zf-HC2 domain-containing protein [Ignavibacteriales bacterium]